MNSGNHRTKDKRRSQSRHDHEFFGKLAGCTCRESSFGIAGMGRRGPRTSGSSCQRLGSSPTFTPWLMHQKRLYKSLPEIGSFLARMGIVWRNCDSETIQTGSMWVEAPPGSVFPNIEKFACMTAYTQGASELRNVVTRCSVSSCSRLLLIPSVSPGSPESELVPSPIPVVVVGAVILAAARIRVKGFALGNVSTGLAHAVPGNLGCSASRHWSRWGSYSDCRCR
jgi:hypothetical protein